MGGLPPPPFSRTAIWLNCCTNWGCSARARVVARVCAAAAPSSSTDVAVSGCLYLAIRVDGKNVTTIEHLDEAGSLSPVQQAFIEAGAFQCGFCTPGFVLMTHQLLKQNPDPSEDEIRHYLSGNLCRCAAYPKSWKLSGWLRA
jgi:aerobic-type carbon monoxide dehydrogenase small subunit (CoxS/CutS family)